MTKTIYFAKIYCTILQTNGGEKIVAVKRAPKINKERSEAFWPFTESEKKLEKIKKLVALRDEVLRLYEETEKACGDDREVTIDGNGVNCYEALLALKPLKKLADKCK